MTQRTDWGAWNIKIMENKIMDYEKKYKENFELAKDWYNDATTTQKEKALLEAMYPELKESEDERILNELIRTVKYFYGGNLHFKHNCTKEELIAYLEKQKEQKPAEWSEEDKDHLESLIHRTTVIASNNPYGKIKEDIDWLKALPERFNLPPKQEWSEEDEAAFGDLMWCIEQARKLAKDENDMGNIWFAEHWVKNRLKSLCSQPKQELSQEDEKKLHKVITIIEQNTIGNQNTIDWLKSLPKRFNLQPKQEWCEEDRFHIERILQYLQYYKSYTYPPDKSVEKERIWLKSLSPQRRWKPSEEQMKALCSKLPIYKGTGDEVQSILESLYSDLKKL